MTILSIVNISIVTFRFSELQKFKNWTSRTPIFGNQEVKEIDFKNSGFQNIEKIKSSRRKKKGEVKRVRYIIVIQLGACYNFNIIDSGKPIFRRINLLWKQ